MGNESSFPEVTCTDYVLDYHINVNVPTVKAAQEIIENVGIGSNYREEASNFRGRYEIENDIKESLINCEPELMKQYSFSVNLERLIYGIGAIGVICVIFIVLLGGKLSDAVVALLITFASILAMCIFTFHFYFVKKQAVITKEWRDSVVDALINSLDDWKERYSSYNYTYSVVYPVKVLLTEPGTSKRERIIGIWAFLRISKGNEVQHSDKEHIKASTAVAQHKLIITNQDEQQTLTYDDTDETQQLR